MANSSPKNKQVEDIFADQGSKLPPSVKSSLANSRPVKQPASLADSRNSVPDKSRAGLPQKKKLYIALIVLAVVVVAVGLVLASQSGLFSPEKNIATNNANSNSALIESTNKTISVPTVSTNAAPDADGDGLTDAEEKKFGTNPDSKDSDNDGLFDREEVKVYKTNPTKNDTDGDGISDGDEVKKGTNPNGSGQLLDLNTARQQTSNTNQ